VKVAAAHAVQNEIGCLAWIENRIDVFVGDKSLRGNYPQRTPRKTNNEQDRGKALFILLLLSFFSVSSLWNQLMTHDEEFNPSRSNRLSFAELIASTFRRHISFGDRFMLKVLTKLLKLTVVFWEFSSFHSRGY